MLSRAGNLLAALATFALGGIMAWNYPLGQFAAPILFLVASALAVYRPAWFLVIIPALLPVIGLAPWTGWITFEELDLLVLAAASGGYARALVDAPPAEPRRNSRILLGLSALMALSILISMVRGISDAGGFAFGWFQGYDGPMNSVRIGKSYLWVLLLSPILAWHDQRNPTGTARLLALGLAVGCMTASVAALWERLAFTGLLNFSTDYRSTALFWEMHVGGAALDGWLLLTIPFILWVVLSAKGVVEGGAVAFLLAVVSYAALTTFSRGVYLGLLVSVAILGVLLRDKLRPYVVLSQDGKWSMVRQLLALIVLVSVSGIAFTSAGYRGLLATLGVISLGLVMPAVASVLPRKQVLVACSVGLSFGGALAILANFLPKGPYWIYTALWVGALLALHPRFKFQRGKGTISFGVSAFSALLVAAINVAGHWGGVEALPNFSAAMLGISIILLWAAFSKRPCWPTDWRWQGRLLIQAIAISGVFAVFAGGAYMGGCFSTVEKDWEGRLRHWTNAINLLNGPADFMFGKGLGRFSANYYFAGPNGESSGIYWIKNEGGNGMLTLVGANSPMSDGKILRVTQRIGLGEAGPFAVDMLVRAKTDVSIHVEICEKHLLYQGACVVGQAGLKATDGRWERLSIPIQQIVLPDQFWLIPTLRAFSFGIANQSGRAEIDEVRLLTKDGRNLLKNPEFSDEMASWFFTSDRDHMPWHAKNLLVNIFFDQGFLGLGVFILLSVAAVWRVAMGIRNGDLLSPYWLAAIAGFWVVGIFDSLTDVPRLAFAYFLVIHYVLIHAFPVPGVTNKTSPKGTV